MTEQGEVIAYRYSNPAIARRHLHQVLNAVLLAYGAPPGSHVPPAWHEAMEVISTSGRTAYRKFVYETPGFLEGCNRSHNFTCNLSSFRTLTRFKTLVICCLNRRPCR